MELTYDPRQNIAYLRLRRSNGHVETLAVSDEINVDVAEDGSVYGIELLNANDLLASDNGMLRIVNAASGDHIETSLPSA